MMACSLGMGSVTAPDGMPEAIGLAPGAAEGFESMLSAGRADVMGAGSDAERSPRPPEVLGGPDSDVLWSC